MRYTVAYETPRNEPTVGETKTSSHRDVACGQDVSFCRGHIEDEFEFRGTLGPVPSKTRAQRTAIKSNPRTAATAVCATEEEIAPASGERSPCRRLLHRFVDASAYCQTGSQTFWRSLPSRSHLVVNDEAIELELSETGTASLAAGREGHRALDEIHLASYKKKPENLAPISFSLTKADSFSFQTSIGHGRPEVTLQSSGIVTRETRYRPLPGSPSPRNATGWVCISVSTRKTSRVWKLTISSATSCAICEDPSCSYGITALSTNASWFANSSGINPGCIFIPSRPTRQSSTRKNMFGLNRRNTYPTARPKTSKSLAYFCVAQSITSRILRRSCVPASMPQNCPGPDC